MTENVVFEVKIQDLTILNFWSNFKLQLIIKNTFS
jgi:hypothetical protein